MIDFYGVGETLISYSYFVNVLAKKHNAIIKSFGQKEILPNWYLHKIYKSFNTSKHIVPLLNPKQKKIRNKYYQKVITNLQAKKDVFQLKILDIWVGIDIYETYLRRYFKQTIILNDPRLHDMIKEGIGLVIFWRDYFIKHKVKAVIISHDCYLHYNVVAKVAYGKKIPVYLPNIRGIYYADKPFSPYNHFPKYRKMFSLLPKNEKIKAINWAKGQLNKRLRGEIGIDMEYSTKSAFHKNKSAKSVLRANNKIKILICSHCFYDNPHGYGGMFFLDFYEWLNFLGKISRKTNYDWYLKIHPDPLPGNQEIIINIMTKYPHITLISHQTSHWQIASEGIDFVFTIYGSVGHEYPLFGVQVINSGYNPRVAYDFNWHAKSLKEYKYLIYNLGKLKKKIILNDIYEFYYMHHNYDFADDLILKSYRKCMESLSVKKRNGPDIYGYFLNELTNKKHQNIIHKMNIFIESGKHNYLSHSPED